MYSINKTENKILKLEEKTFAALGFKEREHLQEWLVGDPNALGEPLLFIQKEFDGFQDTNERLDLLAIDKQGNLVIIENKLDDSGKDVTWQVLKYASYCSTLSKDEIRQIFQSYLSKKSHSETAEERLSDFFDGKDYEEIILNQGASQRIMMVAGKFRKEVTSTVLWLMNFNIRMQCFKVTPFVFGDQLLLNIEQILPIKDTEDFTISMATKVQDEIATQESLKTRHLIRLDFWKLFISECNKQNTLFSNISPSKDNWISIGIGMTGVSISLVISKSNCRTEIYINRGSQEENKTCFDFVEKMKSDIESEYGRELIWERMDDKVSCRIKDQLDDVNIYEREDWEKMISFLILSSENMLKAFKNPIKKLNASLKGH